MNFGKNLSSEALLSFEGMAMPFTIPSLRLY